MNKIFKVIWNHTTQSWVAVSELTKAHGKTKSVTTAVASVALLGGVALDAQGAVVDGSTDYKIVLSAPQGTPSSAAVGNTVAIGNNAHANGSNSTAIGVNVTTASSNSIAMGSNVRVSSYDGSIALGYNIDNQAGTDPGKTSRGHVMIGNGIKGRGNGSITMSAQGDWLAEGSAHQQTWNHGNDSIAIGANVHIGIENQHKEGMPLGAIAIGSDSRIGSGTTYTVAIGDNAAVYGNDSSALGRQAKSYSKDSVAMGHDATAGSGTRPQATKGYNYNDVAENISGNFATAVGAYSTASHEDSSAFGRNSSATANQATALGTYATSRALKATSVGYQAGAYANSSSSLGAHAGTYANHSIAIGGGSSGGVDGNAAIAMAERAIAIGTGARSGTNSSIAIGDNAQIFVRSEFNAGWDRPYPGMSNDQSGFVRHGREVTFTNAMAIGSNTRALERSAMAFGHNAKSTGIQAFAGGYNASTSAQDALALGSLSSASAQSAVAVGNTSSASAENAIAMGTNSLSNAASTVAISTNSFAGGENAIAIGKDSYAAGKKLEDLNKDVTDTLNQELTETNHGKIKQALGKARDASGNADYQAMIDKIIAELDKGTGTPTNQGALWNGQKALDFVKAAVSTATVPLNSAIAIGDSSKSIAEKSIALGYGNIASGELSIAVGTSNRVSGNYSGAFGDPSIVEGTASYTFGNDNVVSRDTTGAFVMGNRNRMGAKPTYDAGGNDINTVEVDVTQPLTGIAALGATGEAIRDVSGSVVIGNDNTVTSKNTFILGNSVNTYNAITTGGGTVENSVYLGSNSTAVAGAPAAAGELKNIKDDGTPGVSTTGGDKGVVNTATVAGVDYQGFQGNKADGVVTVGSADHERRIQNVAAGEISATSTDAINGSQLYLTHKAIDDVSDNNPFSYTVKEGDKNVPVTSIGGKFYKDDDIGDLKYDPTTKAFYKPDGSLADTQPTPIADKSTINVSSNVDDTNSPDTLNNIKGNLPQALNEGDKAQNANTTPNATGVAATADNFTKKQDAPNVSNIYNNAATVGDVLNAGWNLQGDTTPVDFVKPYDTVNFIDTDTANITVASTDGKTSTIKVDVITTTLTNDDEEGTVDTPDAKDGSKLVNASTVVEAINNSGWKITIGRDEDEFEDQQDADEKLIKMGETAIFRSGKNLKVKQENANITFATENDVEFNSVQLGKDQAGPKLTAEGDNIKVSDKDGDNPVNITNLKGNLDPAYNEGDLKEADGKLDVNAPAQAGDITKAQAGPGAAKAGEIYNNAATVGDVLNAGWNLQGNGSAVDFVKPYDTVNFVNGTGTTVVAESADGKTSTIKINTATQYTDDKGTPVTVIDGKGYPVGSIKAKDGNVYPAGTELGDDGNPKTATDPVDALTNAPKISLVDVNGNSVTPTVLGNVAAGTKTLDGSHRGDKADADTPTAIDANANPKLKEAYAGLADLNNSNANNALTVADAKNLGWVVSSNKTTGDLGTEYADDVRNANEVRFVGTGLATVSGKTSAEGVRTITVDVDAQKVAEKAQAPVVYTDKDGNKLVKKPDGFYPADAVEIDGNYYPAGSEKQPDGTIQKDGQTATALTPKTAGDVIASMNDGGNNTTAPMKLANVASTLAPTYNAGNPTVTNGKANKDAPVTDATKKMVNPFDKDSTTPATAEELANVYNNAATVGDVLNAGWNLTENGNERDFVKPYDTVDFVNGQGTTVNVTTSDDGKVSHVRVDTLTTLVDNTGKPIVQVDGKYYYADDIDPKTGKPKADKVDSNITPTADNPLSVNVVNPTAAAGKTATTDPIQMGNVAAGAGTLDGSNRGDKPTADNPTAIDAVTNPALKDAYKGLADLENAKPTNVMTVADAKNLGWVVSSDKKTGELGKEYADDVRNANEVRFVGVDGVTVSGKTSDEGVRTITVALEKGEVTTTNIDEPVLRVKDQADVPLTKVGDKYYKKEDIDKATGLPKDGAQPIPENQLANVVNKGNKGKGFVTGNQVGDAIQESGWNLGKATNAELAKTTFSDEAKNIEKVNPNDNVRFANGKGTIVKAGIFEKEDENGVITTTTTFKIDVDLPIAYEAKDADGNELVKANDGKWYAKDAVDPETGRVTDTTVQGLDKPETLGAKLTTNGNNPDEKAYEVSDPITKAIEDVKKANPGVPEEELKEKIKAAKEAEITKDPSTKDKIEGGEGGVALNNVAWAKEPDQAVNKDQLDQTVNKSGFYVKQNGESTEADNKGKKADADTEKVTPNDVVDFVDGGNTKATATTTREDGRDVTKVSVNVVGLPVQYTDANGNPVAKVGDKFYPVDENGNPVIEKKPDGSDNSVPAAGLTANMINPAAAAPNTKGDAITLGNIKDNIGLNTDGTEAGQTPGTPLAKPGEEARNKMGNNAATVNDVLRAGWNAYVDDTNVKNHKAVVNPTDNVVFKGKDGIKVTSKGEDNGTTVFEFGLEKGEIITTNDEKPVLKVEGQPDVPVTKVGDQYYKDADLVNGVPTKDATPLTPAEVEKVENTTNKGAGFVTGNQVGDAIQASGFTVGKATADELKAVADKFSKEEGNVEKVNPDDNMRFADGKGTVVSLGTVKAVEPNGVETTTTTIKVDVDLPIDFKYVNEAGDEIVKADDGKFYKATDVENGKPKQDATALDADAVAKLAKQAQLTNGLNSNGKPNAKYTVNPEAAKVENKDKPIAGEGGVALNNVAWAVNPDQAVNKDQLDQTVNKSGFFVKQNGKSTEAVNKDATEDAKTEKVTPNDVVDFVDGGNTKATAITTREDGRDVTKVSVNVVGLPVQYTSKDGVPVTKVGDKFFTVDKDGNPTTTEVKAGDLSINLIDPTAAPNTIGKPQVINNVADGEISPDSKQAVNGSQLYALTGGAPTKIGSVTGKDENGNEITIDNVVLVDGKPLKTYDVESRKETYHSSVVEAVQRMNDQGIQFFHTNNNTRATGKVVNNDDSSASGGFSTAVGVRATAQGDYSVALGTDAQALGENTVSIGHGNIVAGKNSGAFGDPSYITAKDQEDKDVDGSYSIGNHNVINSNNTFVLGNNVNNKGTKDAEGRPEALGNTVENSVYLGNATTATAGGKVGTKNLKVDGKEGKTTTAGNKGKVDKANVNGVIYGGFAGDEANGVVSVGASGSERRIQNVAAGEISATSTDAINGSQLYQVAAKLGDINNQMNRNNRQLRAGIAGANAAAGLPQVYIPGKSMVAASVGTYKGQSAVAVGYSRSSDNGKVILKLQGNANTRGDFGGSVGIGYQW